jgi:hypothetical protein
MPAPLAFECRRSGAFARLCQPYVPICARGQYRPYMDGITARPHLQWGQRSNTSDNIYGRYVERYEDMCSLEELRGIYNKAVYYCIKLRGNGETAQLVVWTAYIEQIKTTHVALHLASAAAEVRQRRIDDQSARERHRECERNRKREEVEREGGLWCCGCC